MGVQGVGPGLVLEVDQAGSIGVVTAVGAVLSALAHASWAEEVALGGTVVWAIVAMATGGRVWIVTTQYSNEKPC